MDLHSAINVLKRVFTGEMFRFGETPVSLMSLIIAVVIIISGAVLSKVVQRLIRASLGKQMSFQYGLGYALLRMLHYAFIGVSVLVALQSIGLDLTSLTLLGGFLGVGIGFGLQNVTSNFISGIILLLEQPIRVGDKVTVQEHIGTVKEIGMRSTTIDTFDNIRLIIPNSVFVEQPVINWSHGDPKIRMHIPFGVAYGSDVPKVRKTILAVAAESANVLQTPPPEVRFLGLGDSSLDFELLAWIPDPRKQFRVRSDLYYKILAAFNSAKIEIPFPQRDIHIRSADGLAGKIS
ncbi:MAG: mechanosensitive ion channel domain-containing protein [Elusimicrobiota bacterium]